MIFQETGKPESQTTSLSIPLAFTLKNHKYYQNIINYSQFVSSIEFMHQ